MAPLFNPLAGLERCAHHYPELHSGLLGVQARSGLGLIVMVWVRLLMRGRFLMQIFFGYKLSILCAR